jgi:hypothetical protein
LKRGLWSLFSLNLELAEDPATPMEMRTRASAVAVQAGLAFGKITEQVDLEARVAALEKRDHAP